MSLQELVEKNTVAVVDGEAPRTELGTYTPDADVYGLFCEQYLEKPALLKDGELSIAERATLTYDDSGPIRDDD